MYKLGKEERLLHEILEKFQLSFQAYWLINRYAAKHGQQILNLTPGSYIDAFPRLKVLP
jgi:hypothetical protein